jgi:hypothetical protein
MLACRTVLRSGDIEFIGSPAEMVQLSLPCRDYQMAGVSPNRGRDVSLGRFRVLQRGIRYLGIVVLPAKVSPLS